MPGAPAGRGLDGMRERLAAAGGTLTVSGDLVGSGGQRVFTARAWLPVPVMDEVETRPQASPPSAIGTG
jgi:signal transduction histidine kinase